MKSHPARFGGYDPITNEPFCLDCRKRIIRTAAITGRGLNARPWTHVSKHRAVPA